MNKRLSLTEQGHHFIRQQLALGDVAIDATVGNGHDTLFLAQQVGKHGCVFGFDVQQQAIGSTQSRLALALDYQNVKLIHGSHGEMAEKIDTRFHGKVKAIMFNLGYLPGSDKRIITQANSSLAAANAAVKILAVQGVLTIAAYPGHIGGDVETEQINSWCKELNSKQYNVQTLVSSDKQTAPRLFVINKNY